MSYFSFKTAKPVKVIHDHFGNGDVDDGQMKSLKYIFAPPNNREISAYDSNQGKFSPQSSN